MRNNNLGVSSLSLLSPFFFPHEEYIKIQEKKKRRGEKIHNAIIEEENITGIR